MREPCRVHPDKATRAYELCATCYSRIISAASLHREGRVPTAIQAQTLTQMGRPTAKMLEKWPTLPALIEAAKGEGYPTPPRKVAPVAEPPFAAEVVELPKPTPTPAADLEGLVARLRARAELGTLALDLRRGDYRADLVARLAEQVCHGVEGDAGERALALASEELAAALQSLSGRLEALVMGEAVAAEGVG